MGNRAGVIVGLCFQVSVWAQGLPAEVEVSLSSFPPSLVYLDTARGPSYLGKSGQRMRVKPPTLLDAKGQPVQYVGAQLILKAPRHSDLRVQVGAQDWAGGRLPPGGGSYRLSAQSPLVAAGDYLAAYPFLSLVLVGLVGGVLWRGRVWRTRARMQAEENQQLSARLHTTGDPLLGKKLGRYQVLARLGQGGMGSVYRVEADGGEFAAKVVYFDQSDSLELQRFRREFRVLNSLRHPALLRVFDYGEEAGMAYCVSELVKGQTLNHFIRPGGLPWDTIWPWIRGILEGLICAHQAGVVHRDLKPANLMISDSGVKILDFGLARQVQITAVTLTGQAFGTPLYMAPEQASASGTEVDVRCDLYSLGIILFELLTGSPPFRSDDVQELIAQHVTQEPPALSTLVQDFPPGLEQAVSTLLAKKPANRYASAERVLQVLSELSDPSARPAPLVSQGQQSVSDPETLPVARRPRQG